MTRSTTGMTQSTPQTRMQPATFDAQLSKRVSFVLTTKIRADRLDEALESARSYVGPDDELIVIDGGSNDGTEEVLARYSDLVDVVVSEPDTSAAHALNKGILLARGRYIRHVTDDDILHPEGMTQAIQVLADHPEVDFLVCGGTKQKAHMEWEVWLPPGVEYGKSVEDVFRYGGSGAGFVLRHSAVASMGLQPTGPAGDIEFLLQAIRCGAQVRFCRIKLYHHPIHEQSYVSRLEEEHRRHQYRLAWQYCSRRFYYWYRVWQLTRQSHIMQRLLGRYRQAAGAIRRIFVGSGETRETVDEPFWDGGFS